MDERGDPMTLVSNMYVMFCKRYYHYYDASIFMFVLWVAGARFWENGGALESVDAPGLVRTLAFFSIG